LMFSYKSCDLLGLWHTIAMPLICSQIERTIPASSQPHIEAFPLRDPPNLTGP
jgi:hypothetical protein